MKATLYWSERDNCWTLAIITAGAIRHEHLKGVRQDDRPTATVWANDQLDRRCGGIVRVAA